MNASLNIIDIHYKILLNQQVKQRTLLLKLQEQKTMPAAGPRSLHSTKVERLKMFILVHTPYSTPASPLY
jgi:hypothetical protein